MKPILFNSEMVKAILDDRKTVTRRVVKPQPTSSMFTGVCTESTMRNDRTVGCFMFGDNYGEVKEYAKPPYKVGDILYVRETWLLGDGCDGEQYYYKADETGISKELRVAYGYKWKPSIHMPKEAARIFLKVTSVRVERLQDITEIQAIKEGVGDLYLDYIANCGDEKYNVPMKHNTLAIDQFELLWNSTTKKEWQKFESNPWVWVIEFERISKEVAYELDNDNKAKIASRF